VDQREVVVEDEDAVPVMDVLVPGDPVIAEGKDHEEGDREQQQRGQPIPADRHAVHGAEPENAGERWAVRFAFRRRLPAVPPVRWLRQCRGAGPGRAFTYHWRAVHFVGRSLFRVIIEGNGRVKGVKPIRVNLWLMASFEPSAAQRPASERSRPTTRSLAKYSAAI